MLKERVLYHQNPIVKAFVANVEEYPTHYHSDSLEILITLSGSIKLVLGYRTLLLKEGDIFIVNDDELHGMSSTDPHNKVLCVQINLNHFGIRGGKGKEKEALFLVAETYNDGKKVSEPVEMLIEKILDVAEACMVNSNEEDGRASKLVGELIKYMYDNFRHFSYVGQYFVNQMERKNNAVVAERINKVKNYIYEHYAQKLTLTEIADALHMNMYYLSHLIKDYVGLNFQELLNFARVEISEKLLLGTDKKISEIACDCGFSATRYYEKFFYRWYGLTPEEYREKLKGTVDRSHSIKQLSDEETLAEIRAMGRGRQSTSDRNMFYYTEVFRVVSDSVTRGKPPRDFIYLAHDMPVGSMESFDAWTPRALADQLYFDIRCTGNEEFRQKWISGLAPMMQLEYAFRGTHDTLDSVKNDLCLYRSRAFVRNQIPLTVVICPEGRGTKKELDDFRRQVIDLCKQTGFQPDIHIDRSEESGVKPNYLYDSFMAVSRFFHSTLWKNDRRRFYRLREQAENPGHIPVGAEGLLTVGGIRKPIWFAHIFLAQLGKSILEKGNEHIITKDEEDYQILFYDADESVCHNRMKHETPEGVATCIRDSNRYKESVVELSGITGCYRVVSHTIDKRCCVFSKWMEMGFPDMFTDQEENLLRTILHPHVEFKSIDIRDSLDITVTVPQFGAQFITLHRLR